MTHKIVFRVVSIIYPEQLDEYFSTEDEGRQAYTEAIKQGNVGVRLYQVSESYENGVPTGNFAEETLASDDVR